MKSSIKLALLLIATLLLPPTLMACGESDSDTVPTESKSTSEITAPPGQQADDKVVITIGNLTDKTGAISGVLDIMDMALEDTVDYFNQSNFIPGVHVKVVHYDAQYDPARHIPGYHWLQEKGADLIFLADPNAAGIIVSLADQDRFPVFATAAQDALLKDPGYLFTPATHPANRYYTFLEWVAENDWDYLSNGPAKIGLAGWAIPNITAVVDGVEQYCIDHPEQFEWEGSFLNDRSFVWQSEILELMDMDYVIPPTAGLVTFTREYREAGGDAKFLGDDSHVAFLRVLSDAGLWSGIDEMILTKDSRWWGEEGELVNLTEQLLATYHADSMDDIMGAGVTYTAVFPYFMLSIIKDAAQAVGPENIDSNALYEAACSYSYDEDGVLRYSFTDTKRFGLNSIGIYQASSADKDLLRIDPEWIPIKWLVGAP